MRIFGGMAVREDGHLCFQVWQNQGVCTLDTPCFCHGKIEAGRFTATCLP